MCTCLSKSSHAVTIGSDHSSTFDTDYPWSEGCLTKSLWMHHFCIDTSIFSTYNGTALSNPTIYEMIVGIQTFVCLQIHFCVGTGCVQKVVLNIVILHRWQNRNISRPYLRVNLLRVTAISPFQFLVVPDSLQFRQFISVHRHIRHLYYFYCSVNFIKWNTNSHHI